MSRPNVTVEQGVLAGKALTNIDGKPFFGFQGIPYAKPPLGELRFKAPQPPERWSGTRDATQEGSECYSKHMIFENIIGSEDCLFLNVYTQGFYMSDKGMRPVMVWIHGGGFVSGSSKTDLYGPEYLLTEDIVLVTLNYRLGILGFLQLEDPTLEVPGNVGLKDIVMALKWVQINIRRFGGNPFNVTIFGESAGGSAVHHLVLSPLTKGLFQRAISQSGSALNTFGVGRSTILPQLASALKLENPTEKEVLQLLRALPVEKLYEVFEEVLSFFVRTDNLLDRLPFKPTIEQPSPDAFLSQEPIDIVRSGNYNHVPIIFGYTTREGMLMEVKIRPNKPTMLTNFESLISPTLGAAPGSDASKSIANKIREFYYGEKGSEDNADNFYLLHTDNYFVRDIWFSAKLHAATNTCPVYLYRVSIDTSLNIFKKLQGITAPGASHADDISYLFKTETSPNLEAGSVERTAVDRFVHLWTNFAKDGNPNSTERSDIPKWQPIEKDAVNFVDIGEDVSAGVDPDSERLKFWSEIYKRNPLYSV